MSDSGSLFAVMSDCCPLAAYAGPLLLRDEPPDGYPDFSERADSRDVGKYRFERVMAIGISRASATTFKT